LGGTGCRATDNSLLKEIANNGVAIIHLQPVEKQGFRDATREVYNCWSERIGHELVKKAEMAINRR